MPRESAGVSLVVRHSSIRVCSRCPVEVRPGGSGVVRRHGGLTRPRALFREDPLQFDTILVVFLTAFTFAAIVWVEIRSRRNAANVPPAEEAPAVEAPPPPSPTRSQMRKRRR